MGERTRLASALRAQNKRGEEVLCSLQHSRATRARNELYLSYPLLRAGHGNSGATLQQPSRFLEEDSEAVCGRVESADVRMSG